MADCPQCDDLHPRGAPECPGRRLGQIVAGKYRVHTLIGVGGIGAVYGAEHLGLRRPVALKMLHLHHAGDAEMSGRFVREARELAALGHPGIVDVRDTGVSEDGAAYIEMERLEGVDLRTMLARNGPLAPARATQIAVDVLDALAAIHARGVVHRDLTSANVFLAQEPAGEQVKILDFGFAKAADNQSLTQPGELLGSPMYMSPEQYRDPAGVDARADLYSLGMVLFEVLTGTWPYTARKRKDLLGQVLRGEIQRHPRQVRPDVPEWLDAVVVRALAYERDERFATAVEMKAALATGGGGAAPGDAKSRPSIIRWLFRRGV